MTVQNIFDENEAAQLRNECLQEFHRFMYSLLPLNEQEQNYEGMPRPGEAGIPPNAPPPEEFIPAYLDTKNSMKDLEAKYKVNERTIRNWRASYEEAGYDIPRREKKSTGNQQKKEKERSVYIGSGSPTPPTLKDRSVFPGEFYSNRTRLPPKRWEAWWKLWQRQTPLRKSNKPKIASRAMYRKIFLFGYQLERSQLFFELWYDTYLGEYVIHDRYGNAFRRRFDIMTDAILGFSAVIGEEDPDFDVDKIKTARKIDLEKVAFNNKQQARQDSLAFESEETPDDVRERILDESSASRALFGDFINNDMVSTYEKSRLSKYLASRKFWQIWGKNVEFPPRPLKAGIKGNSLKIVGNLKGKRREGVFVIGYTLMNKIDIEIWYVRTIEGRQETTSFAVFDLTAGEIIGDNIVNINQAYKVAARKISVKISK